MLRREEMLAVAQGFVEGKARIEVSRQIRERLLREGRPVFFDRKGRAWDLDRYSEMVARTTTREAMTQGTINRLREHGIQLAQVSAHHAADFCIYYENVIVSIGPEPHPVYPPISAIGGSPPFHPRCVHVLTPFVERLATEEERKVGVADPTVLNRTPEALEGRYRIELGAGRTGRKAWLLEEPNQPAAGHKRSVAETNGTISFPESPRWFGEGGGTGHPQHGRGGLG